MKLPSLSPCHATVLTLRESGWPVTKAFESLAAYFWPTTYARGRGDVKGAKLDRKRNAETGLMSYTVLPRPTVA
jgi:hypothetical protein